MLHVLKFLFFENTLINIGQGFETVSTAKDNTFPFQEIFSPYAMSLITKSVPPWRGTIYIPPVVHVW